MRSSAIVLLVSAGLLSGACASNSGVVPIGPDTFMVSRQAATGFTGHGNLKAEALREAEDYCTGRKKVMQIVNSTESQPPYIFGNFPKAEVQFMCLDPNDPELARPKMQKQPDVVVESSTVATVTVPRSERASTVRVPIESEPEGADIYLDGVFVGNAPLLEFTMTPGEHLLKIRKEGFTAWSRMIRVVEGAPTRVKATLVAAPQSH